jgi:hypothetical protein
MNAPNDEGSIAMNAAGKNGTSHKSTAAKKRSAVTAKKGTAKKATTTTRKAATSKARATMPTRRTDLPELDEDMELRIVILTQDGKSRKEISEELGGYPIYRIWAAQAKAGLTKNSPKLMKRAEGVGKPRAEG